MGREESMRRYPPVTGALGAAILALFVLPSALNIPQTNPSQTLEFAPIPPEDDAPPPPGSNVASLSLGSSSTAPAGDSIDDHGPGLPPPPTPDGLGARPVTKRCVGNPPRQTEDPMSPPCVAHFEGDNFGATHPGVTGDEITVLFYVSVPCEVASGGAACPEAGLVDLLAPAQDDEPVDTKGLRALQWYFNNRFQTYDRFVHFWIRYPAEAGAGSTTAAPPTEESRRADAVSDLRELQPFAVIPTGPLVDGYMDEVAKHGALSFGSFLGREAEFYRRYPGLIWSLLPSIEKSAELFADFVCTKVAAYPVSFSGNDDNGQPRTLGLLRTTDPNWSQIVRFGQVARDRIEACGVEFAEDLTYPNNADATDTGALDNEIPATNNVASFQQAGVTTVIWPQGFETSHSKAADRAGWHPEWITAGDGQTEGYQPMQFQNQEVWDDHAWVVTNRPLEPEVSRCWRAVREGDPGVPSFDAGQMCTFRAYDDNLQMLFTGIQVAGPRLSVETIDQGFHAIPAVRSTDPTVPTCFFDPGDYTCIKDAAAAWWDWEAPGPGDYYPQGCWRYGNDGQRYFAGGWPEGDVLTMRQPDNVCSAYAGPANR